MHFTQQPHVLGITAAENADMIKVPMGSRMLFSKSALSDLAAGLAILRDMAGKRAKHQQEKKAGPLRH